MIKRVLSEPRKVVSVYDPAVIAKLDGSTLMKYSLTRDFSLIESIDFGADKPTIFELAPLLSNHEDYTDRPLLLFQLYVKKIQNVDADMCRFEQRDGIKFLSDESAGLFPMEMRKELGELVVQFASRDGDHRPFSLPDSYTALKRQKQMLNALNANISNVN